MSEGPNAKRRQQMFAQWRMSQAAFMLGMVLSIVMPLAWGWPQRVAAGAMTWSGIASMTGLIWAFCLGGGEFVRRMTNREIGEPACKWIWQK